MQHHASHVSARSNQTVASTAHHLLTTIQHPANISHLTAVPTTSNPAAVQVTTHLNNAHHNRSQHHTTPSMHSTTQMQKIRQQHQHVNNNNNNKPQHHYSQQPPPSQQQQHQQYSNHVNVLSSMAPTQQLPQQQNIVHAQQQPQPHHLVPHMKSHQTHHHNNNVQQTSSHHALHNNNKSHQQQQHYYAPNNAPKSYKYANNSRAAPPTINPNPGPTTNYITPKTILQNPNRMIKNKTSQQSTVLEPIVSGNNIVLTPVSDNSNIIVTTPIVSANIPNASIVPIVELNAATTIEGNLVDAADSNKENNSSDDNDDDLDNGAIAAANNNNILPNDDPQAGKNSKEKTPMCLVNELARFNKITHQYRLTGEKGPAHCKRFTVTLKLGDEEYSAEGFKIKKAQHLAASEAIEKTKYKHPVPKVHRRTDENGISRVNITPTVELNALAMKLGQQTYYLFDPRQMPTAAETGGSHIPLAPTAHHEGLMPAYAAPVHATHMMPPHSVHARPLEPVYMRRNGAAPGYAPPLQMVPQRFPHHRGYAPPAKFAPHHHHHHARYTLMPPGVPPPYAPIPSTPCKITLIVGKQKFVGMGRTLQQAKHDAAARALQVLKTQAAAQTSEAIDESLEDNDNKSPISQVHEIGIKRSMTVHFKVLREEGPAHMRNFITACIVGSIVTEGEGNGKKISKKRAAEKMLEELKKLPPLTPTVSPVKRIKVRTPGKASAAAANAATPNAKTAAVPMERRKRAGASIKEKTETDNDAENPITKLIQIQQNRKEKEPIFELIAKNGNENSRRREFIIEVSAQGMVARGTGSNKKLAKRNAAQNLLISMGLESDSSQELENVTINENVAVEVTPESPARNIIKEPNVTEIVGGVTTPPNSSKPTLLDVPLIATSAGQVPGILILRQNKKHASKKKEITPSSIATVSCSTESAATTNLIESSTNQASETLAKNKSTEVSSVDENQSSISNNEAATVATKTEVTSTSSGSSSSSSTPMAAPATPSVHMKEQLLYLSKLMGFEVNFSDYPKGNHNEFLTIVTLSTNPPQICHGTGDCASESQNDAAKNALKILSELGLNNATK